MSEKTENAEAPKFPEMERHRAIVKEMGEISQEMNSMVQRQEELQARFKELQRQLPIAERQVRALIDNLHELAKTEAERN
jgi:hypothetical protein